MADSSFDIVNKIDRQEVDNAINQANKEISNRYDFRGTNSEIKWSGEKGILLTANSKDRVSAALEVLKEKLIKRNISLKTLKTEEAIPTGKNFQITGNLVEGISTENAKKINKLIKEQAPKGVKSQIQGEELRVSSKSRNDLQEVISILKNQDLDIPLQFVNYR